MDNAIPQIAKNMNANIISIHAAFQFIDKNPDELRNVIEITTDGKRKKYHKVIWILKR